MANRVRIEVGGGVFNIATEETAAYVHELAAELQTAIDTLTAEEHHCSLNEALVLSALNYLDAYNKSEKAADNMRVQLSQYLGDATRARDELEGARREIDRLQRQLQANAR